MESRDRELEGLFDAARARDEPRVPQFATIVAPRRARGRAPRLGFALAVAATLLIGVAVWRLATPDQPRLVIAFTPGDMYVPTDYLLEMMSFPRAGEIPRIGAADWYPVPLADDASPDTRRTP
jgi:hypothetical protein